MIVSVCGGKGGVGKSTVSLALGHLLDAVVVDADITMPDLPVDSGPTLSDAMAGRVRPVDAVRDDWAVSVLPAGRSLASARASDPTAFASVLRAVDATYDTVVVDGPAGLGADAALPMTVTDACVLVTTPDPAAIADAVRTRSLARELDAGIGAVVLNRIRNNRPPVERQLGGPVVDLPESEAVADATADGLPVTMTDASGTVAERLEELATRLTRVTRRSRFEW